MNYTILILLISSCLVACSPGKDDAAVPVEQTDASQAAESVNIPPPQVWFYDTGEKKSEITTVAGEEDGVPVTVTVVTRWYKNGQMKQQQHIVGGKQHGIDTSWYENGQKSSETNFVNGVIDGVEKHWSETGAEILQGE